MSKEDEKLDKATFKRGISIILDKLQPHKKVVFVILGLSLVAGGLSATIPYITGRIFDEIVKVASGNIETFYAVFLVIGIWFGVKIVGDIANWYVDFHTNKLSTEVEIDYRIEGFPEFLFLPMSFFGEKSPSESLSKVNLASFRLGFVSSSMTMSLLPQFLSIIVALVIGFLINEVLAFMLILALVIYSVFLFKTVPKLSGIRKKRHKNFLKGQRRGFDALDNVREIKQAGAEEHEKGKIAGFFKKAKKFDIDWLKIFTQLNLAQKIIIVFTQLFIFGVSVFLVSEGEITPGELVAFNGYAGMLFGPFITLGRNWQRIQSAFVEITDAEDILSNERENYSPDNAIDLESIKGEVKFKNVHFAYPENGKDKRGKEVLKGISFTAKLGEDIALVGESGVGKSTLIKLLTCEHFPTKGQVIVDCKDTSRLNLAEYRAQVGLVPQEPVLFNDKIIENIRYGSFDATEEEVIEAAKQAHADEFIEEFDDGYEQKVGWRGIKLSVGQKQRIALARSFLEDPSILILDEPTSALDAESEQFIQESIEKLMKDRTTFIIAHRLSTVREADKIIVLDEGKISETGSHQELVEKEGIYHKLYDMQTEFY